MKPATPPPNAIYLCFSQDTDPERARELFRHRYERDPEHVFVAAGLLKAGPAPERTYA